MDLMAFLSHSLWVLEVFTKQTVLTQIRQQSGQVPIYLPVAHNKIFTSLKYAPYRFYGN